MTDQPGPEEIEFDRQRELVVRKSETGLGIDPPRGPTPPIPEELRDYLADYYVEAKAASDRTVLRAGLSPVKPQIVWGQPLMLTMTVANVGESDFEFMFGGDNRGTGRHDRIKINVTDEDGNELPDPHANGPNFGGIAWHEIIVPGGQNFTHTIDLNRFRTINGPGRYKVTCSFAFDEPYANIDGPRKPVIESAFPFIIQEREPDRVAAVLDELQAKVAATPDDALPKVMAAIARFGQDDAVPRLEKYTKTGTMARRTAAMSALPLVPGNAALDVALAGPISEPSEWPSQPIPLLKTDPPTDFTPELSTLKSEGETRATVKCGFLKESWDRNGGSVSFSPSEPYRATYQVAKDVRAMLKSPNRARESGLTEQQLQELRKLEFLRIIRSSRKG